MMYTNIQYKESKIKNQKSSFNIRNILLPKKFITDTAFSFFFYGACAPPLGTNGLDNILD